MTWLVFSSFRVSSSACPPPGRRDTRCDRLGDSMYARAGRSGVAFLDLRQHRRRPPARGYRREPGFATAMGAGAPTNTLAAASRPITATSSAQASTSDSTFTPAAVQTARVRSYTFGSRSFAKNDLSGISDRPPVNEIPLNPERLPLGFRLFAGGGPHGQRTAIMVRQEGLRGCLYHAATRAKRGRRVTWCIAKTPLMVTLW